MPGVPPHLMKRQVLSIERRAMKELNKHKLTAQKRRSTALTTTQRTTRRTLIGKFAQLHTQVVGLLHTSTDEQDEHNNEQSSICTPNPMEQAGKKRKRGSADRDLAAQNAVSAVASSGKRVRATRGLEMNQKFHPDDSALRGRRRRADAGTTRSK